MAGEFTEGYTRQKRVAIKQPEAEASPQTIKQIQNELQYLRQEVDFLKKVSKQKEDP